MNLSIVRNGRHIAVTQAQRLAARLAVSRAARFDVRVDPAVQAIAEAVEDRAAWLDPMRKEWEKALKVMTEAVDGQLGDKAEFDQVYPLPSSERHPCPVEGCSLSAEEHHRLAYGMISENRELKRRLERGGES